MTINETASATLNKILSIKEIAKFIISGKGFLSTTGVIGTINLNDSGIILFGMGSVSDELKSLVNYRTENFRSFYPFYANYSQEGFVLLSTCWQPKSRGFIELNSKNIFQDPLINLNFLEHYDDVTCVRNAVNMAKKLVLTKTFQKMSSKIHWPMIKHCRNFKPRDEDKPSKRYIDCIIRNGALTLHHPQGTSAIGKVVDSNLKQVSQPSS